MDALLTPAGRRRCGRSGSDSPAPRGGTALSSKRLRCLCPRGVSDAPPFLCFFALFDHIWHPKKKANFKTMGQELRKWLLYFCGSWELVPCGQYFAMGPMRGRDSRGRNVFMMSAILNIKLETCWLRKWNIKMEFLKVPPLDPPFVRRGDAMNWSRQLCFQREAFMSWIMNMMNGRQHEKIWLAFGVFKIIVKHIFSCGCLMSSS